MATKRGGKKPRQPKRPVIRPSATGDGSPTVDAKDSVTIVQVAMDKNLLDQEVAFYLEHLPEWHDHEGKHVLIHGQEQFGFFPTEAAALEEGFRRFGRIAFLVKQIRFDEVPRPWTMVIL
jgi:hypothetical protein